MAKKRRKTKRRPIAPPVHSAPGATHGPSGPSAVEPPPARPFTPEPPTAGEAPGPARTAPRTPAAARKRPGQRRRRRRTKAWLYVIGAIVLIAAVVIGRQMLGNRALNQFNDLARANGCSELRETSDSGGGAHLGEGQRTTYDTSPPTNGRHAPNSLNAGVYDRQFSSNPDNEPTIYQAVHSLEHGFIIVWHKDLSRSALRDLTNRYENERKVIVVPYGALEKGTKTAMTAWGRIVTCKNAEPEVIDAFIDRYREARSAPEPRAA